MKSTNNKLYKLKAVQADDTEESEMLKASKMTRDFHYHPIQIYETFKSLFPMYKNVINKWSVHGKDSIKITLDIYNGNSLMVLYFELYYGGGWRLYSVDDLEPPISRLDAIKLAKKNMEEYK